MESMHANNSMMYACNRYLLQHLETGIKMFDYLVEENIDKLGRDFEEMEIDSDPNSADMMFIKELIYGGELPNEQVLIGLT